MITLGIDTCEARGSVAVRRDGRLESLQRHESGEDYSSWLLPAVERALRDGGATLREVGLLAVASGPGSFTGVRVGLTTVKAWAELYGVGVVGVSRLEVMARQVADAGGLVAASFDAQRGQVFGGLYRNGGKQSMSLIEQEMVIAPDDFVKWVAKSSEGKKVWWSTLDPDLIAETPSWRERVSKGETLIRCTEGLAAGIGELGEERAKQGEFTDSLLLDANYVRRSDAEIFWKDPASHGK